MPSLNKKNGVPKEAKLYPKEAHPKKVLPLSPKLHRQEAFHSPEDESEEDTEHDERKEDGHDVQLHELHPGQQRREYTDINPHCYQRGREGVWVPVVCNCKARVLPEPSSNENR